LICASTPGTKEGGKIHALFCDRGFFAQSKPGPQADFFVPLRVPRHSPLSGGEQAAR